MKILLCIAVLLAACGFWHCGSAPPAPEYDSRTAAPPPATFKRHESTSLGFVIDVPQGWQRQRFVKANVTYTAFTPAECDIAKGYVKPFEHVVVTVLPNETGLGPEAVFRQTVESFRFMHHDYTVGAKRYWQGDAFKRLEYMETFFSTQRFVPVRGWVCLLLHAGSVYTLSIRADEDTFHRHFSLYQQIGRSFRPLVAGSRGSLQLREKRSATVRHARGLICQASGEALRQATAIRLPCQAPGPAAGQA
jgi:hypothetical protein